MSSYLRTTKHPKTGNWETAQWLDDHFGPHQYGVKFEDGTIIAPDFTKNFPESRDDLPEKDWNWQERKDTELTVPIPQNDELKNQIRKLYGVKTSHYINFEPRLNQLMEIITAEKKKLFEGCERIQLTNHKTGKAELFIAVPLTNLKEQGLK